MLLGELDSNFLKDVSVVALEGGVESAVTIDDDETELLIVSKETVEGRGIELVSAVVQGLVDRAEGLNIIVDLLLSLAVFHEDNTAEDNETIGRSISVELQLLLGRCDGADHRLASLAGLDVVRLRELLHQSAGSQVDVFLGRDVEGHE